MSNELDPSIAALLSDANFFPEETAPVISSDDDSMSFEEMIIKDAAEKTAKKAGPVPEVDLTIKEFKEITKLYNDEPGDMFNDPAYYKTAIAGENNASQRLHMVLSKYLTSKDIKDKMVYRQQVITSYWELVRSMAAKAGNSDFPVPKKMMLRYAVLLPSLFRPEHKELFSKAIVENNTGEPVFYLDEWFKYIGSGQIGLSATDEVRVPKKSGAEGAMQEQVRLQQLQSKNSGRLQTAENQLSMKENERAMLEVELKSRIEAICDHPVVLGYEPHKQPYSDMQKKVFSEIAVYMRNLSKVDREVSNLLREYQDAKSSYTSVEEKLAMGPEISSANTADVETEFETIRQMAKMTCGRQGNQFPIFSREFYHSMPQGTGFRENVINLLKWIESIDPGAFCRIHKNVLNRIVPFVILIPTYGDTGFCWQPFERYNRVTSRGRIIVPMYPRDLKIAVLTAVADLRWQVAKEKASYHWMEEGLTGQYYEWIDKQKLKGDLKQYFIQDYVLWMTKESEGVQRLDKEVRGIFWRNIPFPQSLKDTLKTRSLVYDDLCKKDANRAMSDGY